MGVMEYFNNEATDNLVFELKNGKSVVIPTGNKEGNAVIRKWIRKTMKTKKQQVERRQNVKQVKRNMKEVESDDSDF